MSYEFGRRSAPARTRRSRSTGWRLTPEPPARPEPEVVQRLWPRRDRQEHQWRPVVKEPHRAEVLWAGAGRPTLLPFKHPAVQLNLSYIGWQRCENFLWIWSPAVACFGPVQVKCHAIAQRKRGPTAIPRFPDSRQCFETRLGADADAMLATPTRQ